jgi:prepilin-type N-terminal cleavage/methylation domain-containing protein
VTVGAAATAARSAGFSRFDARLASSPRLARRLQVFLLMPRDRRSSAAGFTLVELMIVVAIIGLLAAIALPAFSRYVRKSRTVEAAAQLNRLWLGSVSYYQADHMQQVASGAVSLPRQFPGPTSEAIAGGAIDCCGQVGDKCPAGDLGFEGPVWLALSFSLSEPFNYMPSYQSAGVGPAATFTARSVGNLDCDAVRSSFTRRGGISPGGDVLGGGAPEIVNELE